MRLRIGARGSRLALWQANFIGSRLENELGITAEIVVIRTSGDNFQGGDVAQIGIKGVFIKELEEALLRKEVDLAVHSMKDVPTAIPAGLTLLAICERHDVRDCLVARAGKPLRDLPTAARVGTSSVRRQAQVRRLRPDLQMCELRGNVDTRLRKLDEGHYDAIVLAKAGLDRLGWAGRITEVLSPEQCLPAVAQGALGIEARAEDQDICGLLSGLDHAETRRALEAERALLDAVQGGCQLPLGAWARMDGGKLLLDAAIFSADGLRFVRRNASAEPAEAEILGRVLAHELLAAGGGELLKLAGRVTHG
jgi:hydroxymethylbilane synthase